MKTHTKDTQIMDLLKVHLVSRLICDTNQGPLKLNLRKGETKYYFTLDATELDKETNKKLMELLYPKKDETITYYDHSGKMNEIILTPAPKELAHVANKIKKTIESLVEDKEELAEVSLPSTQKKRGLPKLKK